MSDHLKAALALLGRDLAVFPCWANKKEPLTKHGCKDASKDPAVVTAWWKGWPAANIAVATGETSGVVVLDVDVKNGKTGETELLELERKHGPLPETVESITPSKGRHIWFRHPGRPVPCSVGVLAPGLDVRGAAGYVLVPPSYVTTEEYRGAYTWSIDSAAKLAPMPAWLLEAAAPTRRAPRPDGYFADIADGVTDGCRNESLASLTGKLLRVGLRPGQVLEFLRYWNGKNTPPLDDERLRIAVNNIAKRELERFGR